MKNLKDLISQITDERILRVLHQVEQDGMCVYAHDNHMSDVEVYDVKQVDDVIKDFEEGLEDELEGYRVTGDIGWKAAAEQSAILVDTLRGIKEIAHLFAMDTGGNLVKVIDSVEACVEFFGGDGKQ